jgi:hypothetical protein
VKRSQTFEGLFDARKEIPHVTSRDRTGSQMYSIHLISPEWLAFHTLEGISKSMLRGTRILTLAPEMVPGSRLAQKALKSSLDCLPPCQQPGPAFYLSTPVDEAGWVMYTVFCPSRSLTAVEVCASQRKLVYRGPSTTTAYTPDV